MAIRVLCRECCILRSLSQVNRHTGAVSLTPRRVSKLRRLQQIRTRTRAHQNTNNGSNTHFRNRTLQGLNGSVISIGSLRNNVKVLPLLTISGTTGTRPKQMINGNVYHSSTKPSKNGTIRALTGMPLFIHHLRVPN